MNVCKIDVPADKELKIGLNQYKKDGDKNLLELLYIRNANKLKHIIDKSKAKINDLNEQNRILSLVGLFDSTLIVPSFLCENLIATILCSTVGVGVYLKMALNSAKIKNILENVKDCESLLKDVEEILGIKIDTKSSKGDDELVLVRS